jgi:hypothetical protein
MDDPPSARDVPPPRPEAGLARSRAAILAIGVVLVGGAIGAVLALANRDARGDREPLKAGWTRHDVRDAGFTVDLPPGWTAVSTTDVSAAERELRRANPTLASLVEGKLASSNLVQLLAFDVRSPTIAHGFPTNLTIAVPQVADGIDLDAFLAENLDRLRSVLGVSKTIDTSRSILPAGESALIQTEVNLDGRTTALSQFLIVHGPIAYSLSFSTLPASRAVYTALFEEIARSFRYLSA